MNAPAHYSELRCIVCNGVVAFVITDRARHVERRAQLNTNELTDFLTVKCPECVKRQTSG